ncbi:MAG TPA: hypothetical protein VG797_03540, partial [Phycisphaerales bacterium]|nr:hypothetical protein [Phycisphaerales bacterium]
STIGDLVAVGARLSTVGTNTSAGNVTIFRFSAGSWVREQTIPNPTPASVSFFGSSVALSGNRLIVSASSPETVYVYTESGGVWTLTDTIEDPDGGFSQFGYFLAADGHNTLICDPADDTLVANNGAAYVFTADENGNDSCNSPRSVGFGSLIGCNIDATTDGVSGGCGESGKDVWYSLLVPCTGRYQIDTEGSTFDTVLSLYEGVNCPGNFVECDDDDGAGSTSLIDRNLVKGQYIKIRVAGYDFGGGDVRNGTFVLNVTPLAPFNDNCANAADITDGSTPYGTCNATTDGFAENLCNFSGDNQVNNDIWFTYRPLCTSQITISNCGTTDYDSKIAVYADSDCPSAAENPIACDDDACFDHASRVVVNVTVNHTIKIRVGGFSTSTGSGVLTITPAPICPGDTDGVSPVGIGDIAVIIQNWNSDVIGCAEGDPSGNGHVGLEDVAVIIQNWGHACP